MDTLAHGLYGVALVAKNRDEKMMFAAAVSGMMPDLIVQGASVLNMGLVNGLKFIGGGGSGTFPDGIVYLYRATHSLFVPLILALVLFLIKKKWTILALPYALHIFFDIFLHCGLFATRIFYPLSDFHVCGIDFATSQWMWEINYGVLLGIFYLIYLKWYKPYLKK